MIDLGLILIPTTGETNYEEDRKIAEITAEFCADKKDDQFCVFMDPSNTFYIARATIAEAQLFVKENAYFKFISCTDNNEYVPQESCYFVETHENNDGYVADHTYEFASEDEMMKFLNGDIAVDKYDNRCNQNYYETVTDAYAKIEYRRKGK